jgi:two-component system chemotaxis response regulator CheB
VSSFDVVALVTSAGGLDAMTRVLRDIPRNIPAPIVVMQHISDQGSSLVPILERRLGVPVRWINDGDHLTPGLIHICRGRRIVDIRPDCTIASSTVRTDIRERVFDTLLRSVAMNFGRRGLAAVLTGMGSDGSQGSRAMFDAGGFVIAQSEETAEQPSMPHAAIAAGVSLVLPLNDIGHVIAAMVGGTPLPLLAYPTV